jgi:AraC-like DNA-binding protein
VEIPALLRDLGADPSAVLRILQSVGLDADAIADPDGDVPCLKAAQLLGACASHTGCAHFGLLAGQRWNLSHFGAVGRLMRHSRTVGDALRVLTTYQGLHSDVAAAFVLEREGTTSLGYAIYGPRIPHQDQIYDLALAFTANILKALCGPRWSASEVVISRTAPADGTPYRQFFQAPVRFDYEHSAVWFPTAWKRSPIASANPDVRRDLLAAIEASGQSLLVPRLHRLLRLQLLEGKCSGDDLARTLSLHRRTLNRRLKEQGTTFQHVLDEVRFEVAQQLLADTHLAIDDIAAALCYGEVSAFIHAFRRWSGTTPAQWRRTAAFA